MRAHYQALISDPEKIEALLQAGADKARAVATPLMRELRVAVGLRKLATPAAVPSKQKTQKAVLSSFKQYREADGQFYFKLLASDGRLLLQSLGFAAPKEAALAIASLQQRGAQALTALAGQLQAVDGVSPEDIAAALQQWAEASV